MHAGIWAAINAVRSGTGELTPPATASNMPDCGGCAIDVRCLVGPLRRIQACALQPARASAQGAGTRLTRHAAPMLQLNASLPRCLRHMKCLSSV